jgi:signal transduction histidine kinase
MEESGLLRTLHPTWVQRTTQALAKGTGVRENLKLELERFFELLVEAVKTSDPTCLDSILSEWTTSMTEAELTVDQGSSITQLIREIMRFTWQICVEILEPQAALGLTTALVPPFSFAFEKVSLYEGQVRVNFVSSQLKQAQSNLERLDQSKSDFISVAAHELRTPLTLVEGYTSMLREMREPQGLGQDEIQLINGIQNGTRRLKNIVDDMIDVSMLDNHLLQLNFQPVWINRLLQILQMELEVAAAERSQRFCIKDFPGSAEMTFADPERLLQVLRNVLTNAVKYTPDGGEILVDGRKLPGFIEVIIEDTGIGIDPEDQSIIFEKFTRLGSISLHSSGKTKFKGGGPGLGLHIARGIIEAHGGAIWVESPGHNERTNPGSTFHILLPIRNAPPDSQLGLLNSFVANQSTKGSV